MVSDLKQCEHCEASRFKFCDAILMESSAISSMISELGLYVYFCYTLAPRLN